MSLLPKTVDKDVLKVLNSHHEHFFDADIFANITSQPTPEDSRAWSQILISVLTSIPGRDRQKGSDLADGSDVKSANAWNAIDVPRFNGVIKAGTKSAASGNMQSLDDMPYLFFVLWDYIPNTKIERARIWAVRTQYDSQFRKIANDWYQQRAKGIIASDNFQLHPPINKNSNIFTNRCGNLNYPLILAAHWEQTTYQIDEYYPDTLDVGQCTL
jgi:hypothetical protein